MLYDASWSFAVNVIKLEVPIIPGVRQDINRFVGAPAGTLSTALNVRYKRTGEVQRRNGFASTVAISAADKAHILAPCGDLAIWNNNGKVYYGPLSSGQSQDVGFFPTLRPLMSKGTVTADSAAYPGPGLPSVCVTSSGYQLMAFSGQEGASSTRYVHYEHRHRDGRILSAGTLSVASTSVVPAPRIVALGDELILCYRNSSTGISCRRFQTDGTIASGTVSYTGLDSWDISSRTSTRWVLATSDGTEVVVRDMSSTSTVSTSRTDTPSVSNNAISVYANATRWYVGLAGTTSGRVLVYSSLGGAPTEVSCWSSAAGCELPPAIGPYQSTDTVVRVVGSSYHQLVDGAITVTSCRYRSGIMSGTSYSADTDMPWNVVPLSKPFGDKGQYTIVDRISDLEMDPDANDSDLKVCRGLLRRDDASKRHTWDMSLHQHNRNEAGAIAGPAWPVIVTTDFNGMYLFFDKKIIPRGDIRTAWNAYFELVGFGPDNIHPELGRGFCQTLDGTTVGGQLCDFSPIQAVANRDSTTVCAGIDIGFPTPPGIQHIDAHTSGPLEENSTYQYICVYRYHDALGRVHWSGLSNKASITTGAGEEGVTIYVSLEDVTRKSFAQDITLEIYRTEKNGSTFYLEAAVRGSPLDAGLGNILYTTVNGDALLVTRELLYSHSRAEYHMPPAARYVVHTKNRTWLGGLMRGNILQASAPRVPNEIPLFNNDIPNFKVSLPQVCTGMAGLGDVLIAFSKNAVFAVYGEGPNDRGEGSFSEPQVISLAVGCINSRSIVQAEDCVLFQSARGLEILGRGLGAPEYIGSPVRDELEARPFVMSSWYNATDRTAHFVVAAAYGDPPSDVRILVYDFEAQAWSVDTAIDGTVALGTYVPDIGNVLWQKGNGSTGGTIYTESSAETNDGVTAFVSTLEFHDIYPFAQKGPDGRGPNGRDVKGVVNCFDMVVLPAAGDTITQSLGLERRATRSVAHSFVSATGYDEYRRITPAKSGHCTSVQLVMSCAPVSVTGRTSFLGGFLWVIPADAPRDYDSTEKQ
jgi:hypothetical protein